MFAIIGMEVFQGKIQFFSRNSTAHHALECGNPALKDSMFARAKYCRNNFNDITSSFIVLMELTVVNQWHDILSISIPEGPIQSPQKSVERHPTPVTSNRAFFSILTS